MQIIIIIIYSLWRLKWEDKIFIKKKRNQNVIVIDKDEEICESIEESESVVVIQEDATEGDLITRLAGDKCNSVIISTG